MTSKDLDVLEARLRKLARRLAVGITSAVVSIPGTLVAVLEFVVG